jgi:outer membrane protein assembly factor BamB
LRQTSFLQNTDDGLTPAVTPAASLKHIVRSKAALIMKFRLLLTLTFSAWTLAASAEDWPQFRGPGGRSISETATPPTFFGPTNNVAWKVAVPLGYSSPIVTGEWVYLTAETDAGLETLGLNRRDGRIVWRQRIPMKKSDRAEGGGDTGPAAPTPVTDGSRVYAFFGAYGVVAYDLEGREQWRQPLAKANNEASASPILIDGMLIVVSDQNSGSLVEARDKETGRLLWRTARPEFHASRASPFHWIHGGESDLVVPGSGRLLAYDPRSGREKWSYSGTSRVATSSPTSGDNLLFTSSSRQADDLTLSASAAAEAAEASGVNASPFGGLSDFANPEVPKVGEGIVALRPGGGGDITLTHLAWKSTRSIPYAASPLFYKGRLFTIKSGGMVTAYDVRSGSPLYRDERLDALDNYYASPVAAADRIYLACVDGSICVISATNAMPTILARTHLRDSIVATPALVDHTILVRTFKSLYAFSEVR